MFTTEEINIKQSIMHTLDTSLSVPILSEDEMPSDYESKEYLVSHVTKLLNNDDLKYCMYGEGVEPSEFVECLERYENNGDLLKFSTDISNGMFSIMSAHPAIPSCDLAIVQFNIATQPFLAILRLDYKMAYTHDNSDEGVNKITEYKTAFPTPTQMLQEGIIIDMEDLQIKVLERKHELDGVKDYYLSKRFLGCDTVLSSKQHMKVVKGLIGKVAKKFYASDIEKKLSLNSELFNCFDVNTSMLNIEDYTAQAFDNEELRDAFMDALENNGIENLNIQLDDATINRTFTKQTIKLSNGIEVKIPMELFGDKSVVEFINQSDGKVTMNLKGIDNVDFK